MIRNTLFGLSLIAFTAGSAFAGSTKHASKTPVVAAAVAGDTKAEGKPEGKTEEKPAEAPAKKKAAKKEKAPKGDAAKTEMKSDAPKAETAPAK
jgi:hypothetical protein